MDTDLNGSLELSSEEDFDVLGHADRELSVLPTLVEESLQVELGEPQAETASPVVVAPETASVNFGTMALPDSPPPPPPSRRTVDEATALAAWSASVTAQDDSDRRLIDELQRDNERLARALAEAYDAQRADKAALEAERAEWRTRLAEVRTERQFEEPPDKRPDSRLEHELALAAQIESLRDELEDTRQAKADAHEQVRRLEAQVEAQRDSHEARVSALRDEFDALRSAHDDRIKEVERDAKRADDSRLDTVRRLYTKKLDTERRKHEATMRALHAKRGPPDEAPKLRRRAESAEANAAALSALAAQHKRECARVRDDLDEARAAHDRDVADKQAAIADLERRILEAPTVPPPVVVAPPPVDDRVAVLSAKVADLETRLATRQEDIARAVHDAKTAGRIELARLEARHRDELEAKDAQLQRFRFELDGLLDAFRVEMAKSHRPAPIVS